MGMWLSVEQKNRILERVLKSALFGMHYLCSSHSRHLLAHPTAHLSFPPVHSHCGVFLEQAASLSGWWMLSRTQASLTKSWHCCQMPSCSLCGKSVKIRAQSPGSLCARTAAVDCCSTWQAVFNEVIMRRSSSLWAEVPLHICCRFWAGIDHFISADI